jgi:hypothetical protein
LVRLQLALARQLLESGQLIRTTLNGFYAQLAAAGGDNRVGLGGKDHDVEAGLFEASYTPAVAAMTRHGFLTRLMHLDVIVGQDSVEVEDKERHSVHEVDVGRRDRPFGISSAMLCI